MKKFSDELEQDRDFEFLGELFKWQFVHWTVITQIVDEGRSQNGKDPSAQENVQELIDIIPSFIDSDSDGPERMKTLLAGEKRPVPIGQVNSLYEWLLEVSSGRPTEQPSPSQGGRGKTAPSSKVA